MESRNGLPAGGLLLETISESFRVAFQNDWSDTKDLRREARMRVLEGVLSCKWVSSCWRDRLPASLELANDMLEALVNGLDANGVNSAIVDLAFVLESPGLVGAGGGLLAGVFEVGLEVDWLLGLPYYPGSTIKGAVRSLAEELLDPSIVDSIFGATGGEGGKGSISFYDAYPVGCWKKSPYPCLILTGNVVTPHYYKRGAPVGAEYEAEPSPVQHLVVAPGTVFRLLIGVDYPRDGKDNVNTGACKTFVTQILGVAGADCEITSYATAIAVLTAAALSRGFAARSAKGYNRLKPLLLDDPSKLQNELSRSIVKMIVRIPVPDGRRTSNSASSTLSGSASSSKSPRGRR